MENNFKKKIGAALLTTTLLAGTVSPAIVNAAGNVKANDPSIVYSSHVENIGWQAEVKDGELSGTEGKGLRMEAITMSIKNLPGVTLGFDAHVQNIGWLRNLTSRDVIGSEGMGLRLEALVIRATGLEEKGYELQYRAHIQNIGWTKWVSAGEMAGSEGMGLRLEAIEAKLVALDESLEAVKEAAIAELDAYYKENVDSNDPDYLDKFGEIGDALVAGQEAINGSETKEEVAEALADAKANIDSIIEIITLGKEDLDEAQAKVEEELNAYFDEVVNLDDEAYAAKENEFNNALAEGIEAVNNADTVDEVIEARNAAKESIKALVDEVEEEKLDALKAEAKAELEEYVATEYPEAGTDLNTVIAKEQNKIEEATAETLETVVKEAKSAIDDEAANLASTKLKAYKNQNITTIEETYTEQTSGLDQDLLTKIVRKRDSIRTSILAARTEDEVDEIVEAGIEEITAMAEKIKTDALRTDAEDYVYEYYATLVSNNPEVYKANVLKFEKALEDANALLVAPETQEELTKAVEDAIAKLDEVLEDIGMAEDIENGLLDDVITAKQTELQDYFDEKTTPPTVEDNAFYEAYINEFYLALDNGLVNVENAKTVEEIKTAVADAKTAIDGVVEKVEAAKEEAALTAIKDAAKTELESYEGINGYDADEEIVATIERAEESIDNAEDDKAVETLLKSAKAEIDEIVAEREAEAALVSAKEAAITRVTNAYNAFAANSGTPEYAERFTEAYSECQKATKAINAITNPAKIANVSEEAKKGEEAIKAIEAEVKVEIARNNAISAIDARVEEIKSNPGSEYLTANVNRVINSGKSSVRAASTEREATKAGTTAIENINAAVNEILVAEAKDDVLQDLEIYLLTVDKEYKNNAEVAKLIEKAEKDINAVDTTVEDVEAALNDGIEAIEAKILDIQKAEAKAELNSQATASERENVNVANAIEEGLAAIEAATSKGEIESALTAAKQAVIAAKVPPVESVQPTQALSVSAPAPEVAEETLDTASVEEAPASDTAPVEEAPVEVEE